MKIGLAQINPTVGDLNGNVKKIREYLRKARSWGCDLVVFSELSLTGYPPKDLLLRYDFIDACGKALAGLLPDTHGIGLLIGTAVPVPGSEYLYNSVLLLEDGEIKAQVNKSLLSNCHVFEETRYFKPADRVGCITFRGYRLGVSICDIWNAKESLRQESCDRNVLTELYEDKPHVFINLSASPYFYGKYKYRTQMLAHYAKKYKTPFIYVNQTGGNDELVFDGSSMAFDGMGMMVLKGKSFEEDLQVFDTLQSHIPLDSQQAAEDVSWVYNGLVLGMRDYFFKTGFNKTLLGLSGGADSSLVACIAVEALGKENVTGVSMPSRYSSRHSLDDARLLAENLGIRFRVIPIEDIFCQFIRIFNKNDMALGDLAEENIQARIRGSLLMFMANREGRVLVSCENKSEMAVGYSTLYGDMCGGLSVIGDIPKTRVYELCRHVNREREIIPRNVLAKPPSAELRPDQRDEDSLPPYDILDAVLEMYMEENLPVDEIIRRGYDRHMVYNIVSMIDRAEYKRRQAPPVIKITGSSLAMGRKIPLAQGFFPKMQGM